MEEEKVIKINLDEDVDMEKKKEEDKFNEMEVDVKRDGGDAGDKEAQGTTKKKKNPHKKRKANALKKTFLEDE